MAESRLTWTCVDGKWARRPHTDIYRRYDYPGGREMTTVLVTGSTGFLGHHLVDALLRRGDDVIALLHDCSFRSDWTRPSGGSLITVRGDVLDCEFLVRTLLRYGVDKVVHLAAQTQVGIGLCNPVPTIDTNIRGTLLVLEACRAVNIQRVVIASSDKVYGECQEASEGTDFSPQCPYSTSKVIAEYACAEYLDRFSQPIAVTRCSNLYGPADEHWNRLVPGAMRSAVQKKPFRMRSNGENIRDWLYVKDAVDGYLRLLDSKHVGPFNFHGYTASVNEMLGCIRQSFTDKLVVEQIGDGPNNELQYQTICGDKAQLLLKWTPTTSIGDGIQASVNWYRGRCGSVNV